MQTQPQPAETSLSGPRHVAIIMDGNGRWAQARGMPRTMGHKKGAETLSDLLEASRGLGIQYITLYAFSSENWGRPSDEVNDLMNLLGYYLDLKKSLLEKNRIRLRVIGDLKKLPKQLYQKVTHAIEESRDHTELHVTMALSYGSRQELTQAVKALAHKVRSGELSADKIDESLINSSLYTAELPDPDLLIRTGGEKRLSNFLLWQSAYTELFFTEVLWPDFNINELRKALAEYQRRDRRYGNVAS